MIRFIPLFMLLIQLSTAKVEQVHLSLTNNQDEMIVTWITRNYVTSTYLNYGTSSTWQRNTVKATVTRWLDQGEMKTTRYTHRATLRGLQPGQRYYYHIVSDDSVSKIFNFVQLDPKKPLRAAIFADLSIFNGYSIEPLNNATQNGQFDVVFHIGDFAYDLHSNDGQLGDDFMNAIEPMTSKVPYMTIAGNHEENENFNHYINRYTMPKNGLLDDNQFWSFDMGPVHFVGISTEYYGFNMSREAQIQYKWLKQDLEENEKSWTILFMHRPMYCSSKKKKGCNKEENLLTRNGAPGFPGLEKLFNQAGVDMVFWAHEHTYERYWPMYQGEPFVQPSENHFHDSPTPVYTLTGAAGCHTHILPNETIAQPFSVKRLGNFGYSILTVHNDTNISTGFIDVKTSNYDNIDPFVLTKSSGFKTGVY